MKDSIKKLNKQQLQAVNHKNGPLLIIAGAGTGKTTVITERIKKLITDGVAKPEEILALTFTEKAATEMETRVDEAMPLSYGDLWITTFHSFCDQVLRQDGLHIGLPTNYKLMTAAESIDFFKKNLFNFSLNYFRPLGNPNKFIEEILKHFSRLQDEIVTPEEYIKYATSLCKNLDEMNEKLELATVYKEYDELKLKEARFDFGDLILKTIELFQKRPNVLGKYQEKFKYILVDEFQDTNFAQNELVNLLAKKHNLPAQAGNITVVGDDNQSIYRWRGAAISNILQFKETYPNCKTITLNKNYRSTQIILDGAYKLIKHNDPDTLEYQLGINKKLIAVNSEQSTVNKFIHTQTSQEEAEKVAEEIKSLITDHGNQPATLSQFMYGDIAILVRANNHADSFIREFERQGIPHQFLGPSKLFEKEEIVDLISYLKVLYNPEDSENMYRLLLSDIFDFDPKELIKISTEARKKSVSIFEITAEKKDFKNVTNLINDSLKTINSKTAGEILYDFINKVGIYKKILESEDSLKAKNIAEFFRRIKNYENENPRAKLNEVVDYIKLLSEVGESPVVTEGNWQENNAVNILTLHAAKGLEFPIVFMVNLVVDRFPSRSRSEALPIADELIKEVLPKGDFHLQEERRLFYVGMTRAKERLYLTASDYYGEGVRQKKISPFVIEALGDSVNSQLSTVNSKKQIYTEKIDHRTPITVHGSQTKISFLSVSQIETFKICPMHYKLKYIYKLPIQASASISFGISMHETLKEFYSDPTSHKASLGSSERLLEIYKQSFLEEGYINKKHKQEFYKKGEGYLLGFLKNGYDPKIKTISLEEKFTLKINSELKIGGTIDRVDDLGKNRYEIIDYKTGANIPTQKEVDKDMQLSFYSLAVSTIYKVKPEDIKLSLYYLDTQEKITTHRTALQLEELKKEILKIKKEMENSDFKCNNNYFCQQGCEYKMFCIVS